jgi:hypothetical protein
MPRLKAHVIALPKRQAVPAFDAVYCRRDIGGDASQPNAVQGLIMQFGCPIVLGSCDEGVGLSTATIAVHIPIPCTAGVQ